LMMLCRCREERHAAAEAVIAGNGLSHAAVKATEAAAPEAAETSTTAARRIADRPTHAYEATRKAGFDLARPSPCVALAASSSSPAPISNL
jgi:hypothetical protein